MTGHVRVLLAEAAGTFMFFFVGAGAIIATGGDNLVAIALAHGLGLSVAVSAFGWISGGHFNPAVTFGLAIAGKHPWARVPTYWIAQAVGALIAGFALRYSFDFDPSALSRTHVGTPGLGANVTELTGVLGLGLGDARLAHGLPPERMPQARAERDHERERPGHAEDGIRQQPEAELDLAPDGDLPFAGGLDEL